MHTGIRSSISSRLQFSKALCDVMAPLFPSLEKIGEVGAACSFRVPVGKPALDRVQADTNLLGESDLCHPLFILRVAQRATNQSIPCYYEECVSCCEP